MGGEGAAGTLRVSVWASVPARRIRGAARIRGWGYAHLPQELCTAGHWSCKAEVSGTRQSSQKQTNKQKSSLFVQRGLGYAPTPPRC